MGTGPLEGMGGHVKLKPSANDPGPSGPVHETGVRLRRYHLPEAELDRAQLAAALDCANAALLVVDRFGRVCSANAAAVTMLGVERELLQQSYVQNHIAALDREGSVLDRAVTGPRSLDVWLPDGRGARAELTPLANERGHLTHACVALTLGSTRGTDAALEAVGRLVAELAHDINNQLSAALNYVFIVRRRAGADPELGPHLQELQSSAWRAATLTSGLKLLGPRRSSDAERLDLDDVVGCLLPVLRHAVGACHLEVRLAPGLPNVTLARGHLEQLLVMTTLAAVARARARGSRVLALEACGLGSSAGGSRGVRMTWVLAPAPEAAVFAPARLPGFAGGARAPGALKRALKRCNAALGHDASRIWIDLEARS